MESGLKAVIFGATGAVGKTLVPLLVESNSWSKVLCVVRKELPEWQNLKKSNKLEVQIEKDMDKLFQKEQWKLQGYNSMFVCFGSQVKHGQQVFTKVDKTYPLLCADIAINNKIPHYLIVSSKGGNPDSMFLYLRIKGEVQHELKLKKIPMISILKPGLIKNRSQARFGEKVAQFFSFLPFDAIQCSDLGLSLKGLAQSKANEKQSTFCKLTVYENSDLLNFLQEYKDKNKTNTK